MTDATRARLWNPGAAFDQPLVLWACVAIGVALVIAPVIVLVLTRLGKLSAKDRRELFLRCATWAVIAPALLVPLLLGAAPWMGLVYVIALCCFGEYARITGLFRDGALVSVVALGITATFFGAVDHWFAFFLGTTPVTIALIAAVAVMRDQPERYLQRVALATLGFVLFGTGLGHLAYLANDVQYRALVLLLLIAVQGNDIFAYLCGRLGSRVWPAKLCVNTSPNKTRVGSLGAILCTTLMVVLLGACIVESGLTRWWPHLIVAGVLTSVAGQLGDLMLSSIKRDIGIKDTGTILPGHGGLLDRFDSLLLAGPVLFYFYAWFGRIGGDQAVNIFSHFQGRL